MLSSCAPLNMPAFPISWPCFLMAAADSQSEKVGLSGRQYAAAALLTAVFLLTQIVGCTKPFVCDSGAKRSRVQQEAVAAASLGSFLSARDTYEPALPPRAVNRGLLQLGELARLRLFAHKLLQGEPVTVVALGGSVTWGAIQGNGYVSQFFHWLNTTFPPRPGGPPHKLLNRGVGGATSSLFSICTHHFVPPDADLVVVEFAVNDGAVAGCNAGKDPFDAPARRAYEVLLRRLLGWRSRPAVVLLMYYNWFLAKRPDEDCPAGTAGKACQLLSSGPGQFHASGENDLAVLGAYYGLPVLSMRAAVYPLLLAGGKGYNVSTWAFPTYKPWQRGVLKNLDDLVYIDQMHPADATGMRYLADLLIALVRRAGRSLEEEPVGEEDREVAAEPLLPPMVLGNEAADFSQCYLQKEMGPLGSSPDGGFRFVNEQTKKSSEKWGWVATQVGAQVSFTLDTRIIGRSTLAEEERAAAARQAAAEAAEAQQEAERQRDEQLPPSSGREGTSDGSGSSSPGSLREQWDELVRQQSAGSDGDGGVGAAAATAPEEEEDEGEVFQQKPAAGAVTAPTAAAGAGEDVGQTGASTKQQQQQVHVLMGFLKSYEHMGTATVSCTANCSCPPVKIDGHWERPASLPDIVAVEVTPHEHCQLTVTVDKESVSGEHKVKVLSLMVVEGGLSTRYFTGGQLNALGQPERFSEMQWAFKSVVNEKGGAGVAAAAPAATAKGSVVGWRPPAAQKRQTAVRPA